MPKLAVVIVATNAMKHLPDLLASLAVQSRTDLTTIVVDNASTDGVARYLQGEHPTVVLLRNARDRGVAHARNQGITYALSLLAKDGEEAYLFVVRPDVLLEPDFVARAAAEMDTHVDAGAVGGLTLRVRDVGEGVMRELDKMNVVECAGMRMTRARRALPIGAGEVLGEAHERQGETFAPSPAAVLYRSKALADVLYREECFDPDLSGVSLDIDLVWRLRMRGWRVLYAPAAKAYYHNREGAGRTSAMGAWRRWRAHSRAARREMVAGYLLRAQKNDRVSNALLHLPFSMPFALGTGLLLLLTEPRTLFGGVGAMLRRTPASLRKRRLIMERARASAKEMRAWFR